MARSLRVSAPHLTRAGVYKCGFATTQAAYEEAFVALSAALDRVEAILASQRYIAGDALTEADIRLFQTLIRFDEVYAGAHPTALLRVKRGDLASFTPADAQTTPHSLLQDQLQADPRARAHVRVVARAVPDAHRELCKYGAHQEPVRSCAQTVSSALTFPLSYYSSHPSLNVHAIVPVGICDDFSAPHNREKIGPAAA